MELLHTIDNKSWVYVEGTSIKNFLIKKYGKRSMVATYAKKGIYGWNFSVPFEDLRELKQAIKKINEKGNKKDERSKSRKSKRS